MTRTRNDLNLPLLVSAVAVGGVLLWAGVVALHAWFYSELATEHERKVVAPPVVELEERLAAQREVLESYRMIDAEAGEVRLPIERAMELTAGQDQEDRE